ncbi:MAG: hypothetical protein JPMHGGIA_02598 [Saprospiraceae bacterium]|nr:hypothetical protein [Saprospiraceae bacterium]
MSTPTTSLANRILLLNILAFTVCFAAWMINGVLVTYLVDNGVFKWSVVEVGFLLGVPVLVGAIARLPVGILTDRYGGRWVMTVLLVVSAIPLFMLSGANSYSGFLGLSFVFGLAGSTFATGVAYTSLWFPKEKQGTALGIFGAGNIGASMTTLFAPTILNKLTHNGTQLEGWRTLPQLYAVLLLIMAVAFFLGTQNKKPTESKTMSQRLAPLKEMRVWRFGLYYFFVFGSFVALAQWLIPYYVNVYTMSIVSAGFMATAFSLPAGLVRIGGGLLADKFGARILLLWVFGVCIVCLFFLFPPRMEIMAPGEGITAKGAGIVKDVQPDGILIDDVQYALQQRGGEGSEAVISFGIKKDRESFLLLPNASFWHEAQVEPGDSISKGQLIAKGATHIYFQANKWIFSALVFIIGIMMGIGSASVFKHISDYYPANIGTVGGIVGVLGGLGGFFCPIIFGYLLKLTGVWTSCWMFLAVVALFCIVFQRIAIKAVIQAEAERQRTPGALL